MRSSASVAYRLGSIQDSRGAVETAVLVDAGGGREAELGELAAHAGVIVDGAADGQDGVENAVVLERSASVALLITIGVGGRGGGVEEMLTPQLGISSTWGQSARLKAVGVAEATAARAVATTAENFMLTVGVGLASVWS